MTDETIPTAPPEPKPKKLGGCTGKGFVKGDVRINRKGRPRSFDKLREFAQKLAAEPAKDAKDRPIIIDEHLATQAEMILRAMMKNNPERFVEIAWGRAPQALDVTSDGEKLGPTIIVFKDADENSHTTAAPPDATSGGSGDETV